METLKERIIEKIQDLVEDITYSVRGFIGKTKNFFFWGWKLRHSTSYDAHSLYELIHFKLDELYDGFANHGNSEWMDDTENGRMKRLAEARDLALKLFEDQYLNDSIDELDAELGKLRITMEPTDTPGYVKSVYHFPCDEDYYRRRSNELDAKHNKRKEIDKAVLFNLLNEYIDKWWD